MTRGAKDSPAPDGLDAGSTDQANAEEPRAEPRTAYRGDITKPDDLFLSEGMANDLRQTGRCGDPATGRLLVLSDSGAVTYEDQK